MDPIADMLTIIKNGYLARKAQVSVRFSNFKLAIAKVLAQEKFIEKVEKSGSNLTITLSYENQKPRLSQIKRVSKLGLRVYAKHQNIKSPRGGRGITIISTPHGVMSSKEARLKKLGGEVICEIW